MSSSSVPATDKHEMAYDVLHFALEHVDKNDTIFQRAYPSAEEKYRVLEARDKLLRARIPKVKVRVELATRLFGTCPDMCPEKERYMRQYQRQLTSYESLSGPEYLVDHKKAIKVYSRSSADQEEPLPHELRPASTLELTFNYLLHNIVPLADNNEEVQVLGDWYNFLWDRTRSIRKDITQQQLTNLEVVGLLEKCTRFHIHCSSRLCELDVHSFDPKLNDENLMKCLQSLEQLYDDLRRRDIKCPNEPEFRAYQIMMNLNEGDILWDIQQRPDWILKSWEVQAAIKIHHCIFNRNFVGFFRLVKSFPYMFSCICQRYFFQVRSRALNSLAKSSAGRKPDVQLIFSQVQRMLGYGEDPGVVSSECQYFCESHGLTIDVSIDRMYYNRSRFSRPDRIISRELHLIDSKQTQTTAESINGGPLGENPALSYVPHSSFDENGYLKPGLVAGEGSDAGVLIVPPKTEDKDKVDSFVSAKPEKTRLFRPQVISDKPILSHLKPNSKISAKAKSATPTPSPFDMVLSNLPKPTEKMPIQQQINPTPSIFGATSFGSSSASTATFGSSTLTQKSEVPTPFQFQQIPTQPTPSFQSLFASNNVSVFGGKDPISSSASVFGGFSSLETPKPIVQKRQPNPEEIKAKQQEIINKICDEVMEAMIQKFVTKEVKASAKDALQQSLKEKEMQQKLKLKEDIRNNLAEASLEKVLNRYLPSFVKKIAVAQIQEHKNLHKISESYADYFIGLNLPIIVKPICKEEIEKAENELQATIQTLSVIFKRLKLRFFIQHWRSFVKRSKQSRELKKEKMLNDMLNFPASNAYGRSPAQILALMKGPNGKSPNLDKLSPSTTSLLDRYEASMATAERFKTSVENFVAEINRKKEAEATVPILVPRRVPSRDYVQNYWKRRWNNGDSVEDGIRASKSPRQENTTIAGHSSTNLNGHSPKISEAQLLLEKIKKFSEETRREKENYEKAETVIADLCNDTYLDRFKDKIN